MNHEKILKLYALAKHGKGGEQVNAVTFLKRLLSIYNYTISMYEDEFITPDEKEIEFEFKYANQHEQILLTQLVLSFGIDEFRRKKGKRKREFYQLTRSIGIQIEYLFELYKRELKKELDAYVLAFCFENGLHWKKELPDSKTTLTAEDMDKQRKINKHRRSIDPLKIRKGIE